MTSLQWVWVAVDYGPQASITKYELVENEKERLAADGLLARGLVS